MQQLAFLLLLSATAYIAWKRYSMIYENIQLGVAEPVTGPTSARWRRVLLIAFGQKKMFKRLLPAVLHLFVYVAFLFTQIELVEIIIDGVFGTHRFFAPYIGGLYSVLINSIEILSILALVGTIAFLWRRNVIKVRRFFKPEMKGWPFKDANLILLGELLLIFGIFSMNSADAVLQMRDPAHYPETHAAISHWLGHTFLNSWSTAHLVMFERFGWWLHLIVVFGFIIYLTYSKHLHILFAFFNTYFAPLVPRGRMSNMPALEHEVKVMMGLAEDSGEVSDELPEFGANDVFSLSRSTLLGAYSCTECGRCTDQCPANLTGKKLSPRKIMMDIRDRMQEVGMKIRSGSSEYIKEGSEATTLTKENFDDGKSLFDSISREEIYACTTCNACVEACPILIDPLRPILEMRRYEILTDSAGPTDWLPMFTSLENSQSPWQIPQDRNQWAIELKSNTN